MLNEMKSRFPGRKLIILFIMFLTGMLSAQNWTAVKETNINVANAQSVDIFTNGYGNHIIVQWDNSLLYYNMDVNGVWGTAVTLESSAVVSPSITGDANNIYVVYRKSNETFIKTKYSSGIGNSWQYLSTNPPNSNANSIESVYSNNKLHVTYTVNNVVKYSRYENLSWTAASTVSTGENGSMPRITAWYDGTQDRVYFLYSKNSSESRWREYNATTNSWVNNPQTAFTTTDISYPAGFRVDGSRIYVYYSYYDQGMYFFNWVVRYISNNAFINSGTMDNNLTGEIFSTYTANGGSHTAFYYTWLLDQNNNYEIGIWRSNSNDGYPSDLVYEYTELQYFPNYLNLSSSSNDVYVIWQDAIGGNNLRMKYDDQVPLAPQNLAVVSYLVRNRSHPKLTWTLNNEPDVYISANGYQIWRRTKPAAGSWSNWTSIANLSGTVDSYIDYDIIIEGTGVFYIAEYKIRAIDKTNHYSPFSSVVSIQFGQFGKKSINGMQEYGYNYQLSQNYPNPFNPSTEIKYTLAKDSYVTVKVYDMLGTEVRELANEQQTAGTHTVNFNASNLPSGVYIYRIIASKNGKIVYTNAKQMILLR